MNTCDKPKIRSLRSFSVLMVLFICTAVFSCGLFRKSTPQVPAEGNIRSITKTFPDNSRYYLLYDFPQSTASLVPVYPNASMLKMYVYGDSNMDMVFETRAGLAEIQEQILTLIEEKGWNLERSNAYPDAEHGILSVPLQFNGFTVDTVERLAGGGRVIAAHSGGVVSLYRLISNVRNGTTTIIQQLRISK